MLERNSNGRPKPYYNISEIFDSIQGEGCYMGVPATFIRFATCNLSCSFCDEHRKTGHMVGLKDILEKCHHRIVILTGGEPTIQDDLKPLCAALNKKHEIHIETNGTTPILPGTLKYIEWVTVSPKTEKIKVQPDELKYVVTPEFKKEDICFDYVGIPIWLQPMYQQEDAMLLKCYDLAMNDDRLRVGYQLHKHIGGIL